MGSQSAWSPPEYDPVERTLMDVMCNEGLAEEILDYVLEEDIAFQVRPIYHAIDPLTRFHLPNMPPLPPRLHLPGQLGRTIKLDSHGTGIITLRDPAFRFRDNPFLTFMEHNPWQVDNVSVSIDNMVARWPTEVQPHSDFLSVRLTCHEMYFHAWRVAVKRRGMIVQVLGLGAPDLRNIVPHPAGDQMLLRHPRIDDIESRLDTLSLVPTFDTAVDYSAAVHHLPSLRWVIPGSVHVRFPDTMRLPVPYFSANYFYCGLMSRQQEALDWLLALIDHLARPRMFIRPDQTVTLVRQISFNGERDPMEPTLNMLVGYDLTHTAQSPNAPYIIYAALEPNANQPGWPPYRVMWTTCFIRRSAILYMRRRAAAPPPGTGTAGAHAPVNDVGLGFHMGAALQQPDQQWATRVWQKYAQDMRRLFPFTVEEYVHRLYSGVERVFYLFHRG